MEPVVLIVPFALSVVNCVITCIHIGRVDTRINRIENFIQTFNFRPYVHTYQAIPPPPSAPPAYSPESGYEYYSPGNSK
jgi:hypothetical protein